jgi:signal transduction histidine kinase
VPVYVSAGAIDYGNRHWLLLICIDMSEQRRLEAQLVQSEKMAAIGQLAAGIAHELRNPLAIVMNVLYDLRARIDCTDREVNDDLASPRRRSAAHKRSSRTSSSSRASPASTSNGST